LTLLARTPVPFRLVYLAMTAMVLGACNEPKSRPGEQMAGGGAARRLEPAGGAQAGDASDGDADASPGTAQFADDDLVQDVANERVAADDARPKKRMNPPAPDAAQNPATAEPAQPPPQPKPKAEPKAAKPAAKGQKTYVVQRGDSLWRIAQKQYGDGRAWRKIYNANRGRIVDPRDVPIGTKLIIP